MEETNDIIKENNYILREIKYIKGKKNILPENIEFLEDYAEIHEIKDIKSTPKLEQGIVSNQKFEFEVRLEENQNSLNNEMILEEKEETILENENINNLIENIFAKIEGEDNLEDCNDLKIAFNSLKEDEKNEVIEGIKIKIDNEEQENKFNNLLKLLC